MCVSLLYSSETRRVKINFMPNFLNQTKNRDWMPNHERIGGSFYYYYFFLLASIAHFEWTFGFIFYFLRSGSGNFKKRISLVLNFTRLFLNFKLISLNQTIDHRNNWSGRQKKMPIFLFTYRGTQIKEKHCALHLKLKKILNGSGSDWLANPKLFTAPENDNIFAKIFHRKKANQRKGLNKFHLVYFV